ncbi:MAG: NAD(P)H-dependent oxidoreductase [Blautia sp.]|nr:NAD(P)H-dependent oxidoreductase [Blautia sp.]
MMRKYGSKKIKAVAVLLMFVMVISMVNIGKMTVQAKSEKKNIVVLYFSATGTTKGAAKKIQKKTKGKLIEIKAADPYTDEDLDYGEDDSRVVKEHESAASPAESDVRPEISNLKEIKKAVKKADVVYIGYPIWWGEAPHIVYTLVEKVSLKGKTVVPFSTSISSGLGDSAKNLKKNATISSKTKWLKGRNFYDIPSQKTVNKWIDKLKY